MVNVLYMHIVQASKIISVIVTVKVKNIKIASNFILQLSNIFGEIFFTGAVL